MTAEATLPILAAFTGEQLCLLRVDGRDSFSEAAFCTQTAAKRSMSCDVKRALPDRRNYQNQSFTFVL